MAQWQDYESNSQLVLVFGHINAKIWVTHRNAAGAANGFGIITPFNVIELPPANPAGSAPDPTLDDAKKAAEDSLRVVLTKWNLAMPPADV